jgi:hypothetical protein
MIAKEEIDETRHVETQFVIAIFGIVMVVVSLILVSIVEDGDQPYEGIGFVIMLIGVGMAVAGILGAMGQRRKRRGSKEQ